MQAQNRRCVLSRLDKELCEVSRQGSGFKASLHGVAGLRVGKLKVEQVAGLLAHACTAESHTSWG
jgi:hypothetical protein